VNLNNRIERMTMTANAMLREKKSETLVLIAPNSDVEKGWVIDVCNNYKTGKENKILRKKLEACNSLNEITEALNGYATNVPNVERSNVYK